MIRFALFLSLVACLVAGVSCAMMTHRPLLLSGRTICIDPGHGGTGETDFYRVGPTGEREEWVNLRVAEELRRLLEAEGARVVMTRTEDVAVELKARADLAREAGADLFLSLHHNATADREVNFPIIYFHGAASENQASVLFAQLLGEELRREMFDGQGPVSVCSDHTIFPSAGASVLRHSYGIPGVIGEASFFSNAAEELRLKDRAYNLREGEAYRRAILAFFAETRPVVQEKGSLVNLPPFRALQEAERMNDDAKRWRENFEAGRRTLDEGNAEEALRLLELSARSFPDSPVARQCHLLRGKALELLGRKEEREEARLRAAEFYPVSP